MTSLKESTCFLLHKFKRRTLHLLLLFIIHLLHLEYIIVLCVRVQVQLSGWHQCRASAGSHQQVVWQNSEGRLHRLSERTTALHLSLWRVCATIPSIVMCILSSLLNKGQWVFVKYMKNLRLSVPEATVRRPSSPWSRWTAALPTSTSLWWAAVSRVWAPATSCGNVSDRTWANFSGGLEPPTGSTPGKTF